MTPINHEGNLVQSPSEKDMFSGSLCQTLVMQWRHNIMLAPASVQRWLGCSYAVLDIIKGARSWKQPLCRAMAYWFMYYIWTTMEK